MPTKEVPLNGAVLAWAREESGLSLETVAASLDIDEESLATWESGESRPSKGQFTKLVKLLKRPSAVFFLPKPPTRAAVPTSFRLAPGLGDHRLNEEEVRQIRWARRLQEIVSWALRDAGEDRVVLPQFAKTGNPLQLQRVSGRRWPYRPPISSRGRHRARHFARGAPRSRTPVCLCCNSGSVETTCADSLHGTSTPRSWQSTLRITRPPGSSRCSMRSGISLRGRMPRAFASSCRRTRRSEPSDGASDSPPPCSCPRKRYALLQRVLASPRHPKLLTSTPQEGSRLGSMSVRAQ